MFLVLLEGGFDAFYARSLSRPRVSKMDRVCLDPFALFSTRNDDGSDGFAFLECTNSFSKSFNPSVRC